MSLSRSNVEAKTEAQVVIRPAKKTEEDCKLVFNWRNDPVTRQMSHNTELKIWDQFQTEYYEQYFQNLPLFALIDETKIGFVSFIKEGNSKSDCYVIGINLAPEFRGLGLGTRVISAGLKYIEKHYPEIKMILARIKTVNQASIKIFKKAGFLEDKSDDKIINLIKIFER